MSTLAHPLWPLLALGLALAAATGHAHGLPQLSQLALLQGGAHWGAGWPRQFLPRRTQRQFSSTIASNAPEIYRRYHVHYAFSGGKARVENSRWAQAGRRIVIPFYPRRYFQWSLFCTYSKLQTLTTLGGIANKFTQSQRSRANSSAQKKHTWLLICLLRRPIAPWASQSVAPIWASPLLPPLPALAPPFWPWPPPLAGLRQPQSQPQLLY